MLATLNRSVIAVGFLRPGGESRPPPPCWFITRLQTARPRPGLCWLVVKPASKILARFSFEIKNPRSENC